LENLKIKVKNISEDENDTEGVSSKGFSINDKEMQNKYHKSIEMFIIGAIIALTAFIWDAINLFIIALLTIPIGILIWLYGLYGIYSYKFKPEKYRKALEKRKKYKDKELSEEIKFTADEIKRNYYKFLAMVIIIPIVVFLFLSPLTFFIFGYLGPIIIIMGSIIIFGIFGYNLRKMTNRYKGIIEIINGIVILSIGLWFWYFYEIFYGIFNTIFGIIFSLIGLVITPYGIYKLICEMRTKGS